MNYFCSLILTFNVELTNASYKNVHMQYTWRQYARG